MSSRSCEVKKNSLFGLHSSCLQDDVLEACAAKGIVITAYSPLGSDNSPLLANEVVTRIAEKHGVSSANVLVSFQANTPNVNGTPFHDA